MRTQVALLAVVAAAAVFALAAPAGPALAESDGAGQAGDEAEGEYPEGEHEGKTCPFKERGAHYSGGA